MLSSDFQNQFQIFVDSFFRSAKFWLLIGSKHINNFLNQTSFNSTDLMRESAFTLWQNTALFTDKNLSIKVSQGRFMN